MSPSRTRDLHYELDVVQYSIRARMCGFGDKDRRLLSPPLIVKLEASRSDGSKLTAAEFDATRLVLAADLRHADDLADANLVPTTSTLTARASESASEGEQSPRATNLVGTLHANSHILTNPEGDGKGVYFVLPDLSVRTEGSYRLRLRLLSIDLASAEAGITSPVIATTDTNEFHVYGAKKFPGMLEPTPLSRHFAAQGVRIPVRRTKKPTSRTSAPLESSPS
ncbi:velvet factor family protein [Sporobolomyces salmoneus]|uniref:velvet factor family protein n=1 Tax=Sporobolomyces salmoneus TaxID=183962 RepID=UPI00317730DD